MQDYRLLVLQEGEIRLAPILYVHFRNSRWGGGVESTSGVGNPCAPHLLNKSLLHIHQYAHTCMYWKYKMKMFNAQYKQEFITCDGKRVSNSLYTLCNKSSESNVTSRLAHVTKPVCKTLGFSPDYAK